MTTLIVVSKARPMYHAQEQTYHQQQPSYYHHIEPSAGHSLPTGYLEGVNTGWKGAHGWYMENQPLLEGHLLNYQAQQEVSSQDGNEHMYGQVDRSDDEDLLRAVDIDSSIVGQLCSHYAELCKDDGKGLPKQIFDPRIDSRWHEYGYPDPSWRTHFNKYQLKKIVKNSQKYGVGHESTLRRLRGERMNLALANDLVSNSDELHQRATFSLQNMQLPEGILKIRHFFKSRSWDIIHQVQRITHWTIPKTVKILHDHLNAEMAEKLASETEFDMGLWELISALDRPRRS